jgi:hypothetical protein
LLDNPELLGFCAGFLKNLWRGIKKVPIVGGIAKGAESGVRGVSNLVSGDWSKDVLGDLGAGLGSAALGLGIPGLLGHGPLAGLLGGKLGGAAKLLGLGGGGAGGGGVNIPGVTGPGGVKMPGITSMLSGGDGSGGDGGILDWLGKGLGAVGDFASGKQSLPSWLQGALTVGGLGLGAADLYGQHKQRESNQAFRQDQLDTLKAFMAKGEAAYDEKAGLRDKSRSKIMANLDKPGVFAGQLGL